MKPTMNDDTPNQPKAGSVPAESTQPLTTSQLSFKQWYQSHKWESTADVPSEWLEQHVKEKEEELDHCYLLRCILCSTEYSRYLDAGRFDQL
jgi:hypothetical protein